MQVIILRMFDLLLSNMIDILESALSITQTLLVTESADQLFATDLIRHYHQLGDVHMAAAGGSVIVLQLSSSD